MKTIKEMSADYSIETYKEIHPYVQDAYIEGAKAVLKEIEKAWNSSTLGFMAEQAVIKTIYQLKRELI